jgi:hypothetical protein
LLTCFPATAQKARLVYKLPLRAKYKYFSNFNEKPWPWLSNPVSVNVCGTTVLLCIYGVVLCIEERVRNIELWKNILRTSKEIPGGTLHSLILNCKLFNCWHVSWYGMFNSEHLMRQLLHGCLKILIPVIDSSGPVYEGEGHCVPHHKLYCYHVGLPAWRRNRSVCCRKKELNSEPRV